MELEKEWDECKSTRPTLFYHIGFSVLKEFANANSMKDWRIRANLF